MVRRSLLKAPNKLTTLSIHFSRHPVCIGSLSERREGLINVHVRSSDMQDRGPCVFLRSILNESDLLQ
jgi:hypothetical protein